MYPPPPSSHTTTLAMPKEKGRFWQPNYRDLSPSGRSLYDTEATDYFQAVSPTRHSFPSPTRPSFSSSSTPPLPFYARKRKLFTPSNLFGLLGLSIISALFFLKSHDYLPLSSPFFPSFSSSNQPLDPSPFSPEEWLTNTSTVNEGQIPFYPSRYNSLLPVRPLAATSPVSRLSLECLNAWIAQGELCPSLEGAWKDDVPVLDFIWTWVNGSDQHMATWREEASRNLGLTKVGGPVTGAAAVKHFR